jgi:hypothetical protein
MKELSYIQQYYQDKKEEISAKKKQWYNEHGCDMRSHKKCNDPSIVHIENNAFLIEFAGTCCQKQITKDTILTTDATKVTCRACKVNYNSKKRDSDNYVKNKGVYRK